MRTLYFEQKQSVGDIVVLTGAIRDLKLAHPDYHIMMDTTCYDIWHANPHVEMPKRSMLATGEAEWFYLDYNDIHNSGWSGRHFSDAFRISIAEKLGVDVPCTSIRPDIHLTDAEKECNPLEGKSSYTGPYWVINAGYKHDFPLKDWGWENWCALVTSLRSVVQFVQVGEDSPSHTHCILPGAIDLRGQTNLRELIRLIYHSQGVVGPVSCQAHIAAAFSKPSVVVGGGREPYRWEAYPDQAYLHTNGRLPCCRADACWKKWSCESQAPDHDRVGDWRKKICDRSVDGIAECMRMISVPHVTECVLQYQRLYN